MKKTGGTNHICEVCADIIDMALPIQCVEAVFLGAYLTSGMTTIIRIPMSFKSKFRSKIHRHIVLAVFAGGKWGCLGISRRKCLMYKQIEFTSLWDLIQEFIDAYTTVYHRLLTVYFGLPMPHDLRVDQKVVWKAIKLRLTNADQAQNKSKLDMFLQEVIKS